MQIYGHRGAAGESPENTITSCLHAIERGVKFTEVDLRLSADGKLVVIHDKTLKRTTGESGISFSYFRMWGDSRSYTSRYMEPQV